MNDPTTDEAYLWPAESLRALQDAINEDIATLARISSLGGAVRIDGSGLRREYNYRRPAPCSLYEASDLGLAEREIDPRGQE